MKTYYYQIPQKDIPWDECVPITQEFKDRESAVAAAYLLSLALHATIRFTDNEYYKGNSGSYITHDGII